MPRPPPTPCARSGRASRSNTPSRAAPRRAAGRAPPSAASAAVGRHSIPEVRRRRLGCQHRDRLRERHDALAVLAEGAGRDRALLRLPLPDDDQVRNLGEAVPAPLIVALLVAQDPPDAASSRLNSRPAAAPPITPTHPP